MKKPEQEGWKEARWVLGGQSKQKLRGRAAVCSADVVQGFSGGLWSACCVYVGGWMDVCV